MALPLAIVRDLMEGQTARQRISEVTMVNALMPIVAPVLGSWLLLLGSWRLIFGMQAVFAGLVLLLVVFDFKESLPRERRQGMRPARLARNYWQLLTHRQFLGYSLVYALNFSCIFFVYRGVAADPDADRGRVAAPVYHSVLRRLRWARSSGRL